MDEPRLSLSEYAVLGLVAEGSTHGFAIARELAADGSIGRVLTVRRSLAYRALDHLVAEGLARPTRVEAGEAGPQRRVHRITPAGRRLRDAWLGRPVRHLRDMRLEFRLKLVLLERIGVSPLPLVRAQREELAPAFRALRRPARAATVDHVELWRRHSTAAIAAYLDELERRSRQ
ncbi:MAG TPA: PadR family transcriptional regulator [Candidatus Limnocylindria bacterium]